MRVSGLLPGPRRSWLGVCMLEGRLSPPRDPSGAHIAWLVGGATTSCAVGGRATEASRLGSWCSTDWHLSPCVCRSLVLNRLRPARGGGRVQLGSPRWRDRGYRCIGGVLYRVTANKLAKTPGRPSAEGACRPLLRTGEAP